MRGLGLMMGLMLSLSAHAGFFGAEPPKNFLDLPVTCAYCGGNWFKLSDMLAHGFVAGAEKSWEKVEDGQWLLKVAVKDKMSDQKIMFRYLFAEFKGVAMVLKTSANGEEVAQAAIPTALNATREAVWAKVGKPKEQPAASAKPPPELLSGVTQDVFDVGQTTIGQLVAYLNTIGKAEWRQRNGEVFIEFVRKDNKEFVVDFEKRQVTNEDGSIKSFYMVSPWSKGRIDSLPNEGEKWITAAVKQSKKK